MTICAGFKFIGSRNFTLSLLNNITSIKFNRRIYWPIYYFYNRKFCKKKEGVGDRFHSNESECLGLIRGMVWCLF